MVISEGIKKKIEEKVRLYDVAKDKIKARIKANIRAAIEKLEATQIELLDKVERNFGVNPFAEFLANTGHTNAEAKSFLAKERIPESIGSDEESLSLLLEEISSFKMLRKSQKISPFDFVPKGLKAESISCNSITLSWDRVNSDCVYEIELRSSASLKSIYHTENSDYILCDLKPVTEYQVRVRAVAIRDDMKSLWSYPVTIQTKDMFKECCTWKKCPNSVDEKMKYNIYWDNPRVATKVNDGYCTVIGNTPIPLNTVTSWSIKVLKSKNDNGDYIYIGVAPSNINQNTYDNRCKCGWYFDCGVSTLLSGPPHNYNSWPGKEYGPRNIKGKYVQTGDSVGVVMDTTRGDLSFVLNGVNLGVAYGGVLFRSSSVSTYETKCEALDGRIPLDVPIAPCVILGYDGDSAELIF